MLPILCIKKNEERRILAGHLWIYSNEIDTNKTPLSQFQPGQLVLVQSFTNRGLGIAYLNPHNLLCARLLTRNIQSIDVNFFKKRIRNAFAMRESLFDKPFYRLIFGESDSLPGLIVDRFGDVLVAQITTMGMEKLKSLIFDALIEVIKPTSILWGNDVSIREIEGLSLYVEPAYGNPPSEVNLQENGSEFLVPILQGQKTGWFYDQSYNRSRLARYVKGKRVLDAFSYVGAWGVQAAKQGAKEVLCVDSSNLAIEYVQKNVKLNNVADIVKTTTEDIFTFLKKSIDDNKKFDVIILDPPAFVKKHKDLKLGLEAYCRLNDLAMQLSSPSGILMTFSCSMHVSRDDFLNMLRKASLHAKKEIRIIEQFHQAQDHPIHPAIKETEYLKGFLVKH